MTGAAAHAREAALPRLAYVGEVPIRNLSAGPLLLYRLLRLYPSDRLAVAESDDNPLLPEYRLPGVPHLRFHLLNRRWTYNRLSWLHGSWVYLRAPAAGRAVAARLRKFQPEAVLGVAHGFGWISASAAARSLGVPLHLIVHDRWETGLTLAASLTAAADRRFGQCYRNAASRMPVSPEMEAYYRGRYGVPGTVVYPGRVEDVPPPPSQLRPAGSRFVFAYAGSVPSPGHRRQLVSFAHAVDPFGAVLRIYQNLDVEEFRRAGLRTANLEFAAFRPASQLVRDLRLETDALYLPMSFAPEDRANVELCFPSKLADYTAAGLPILLHSPDYATATGWAKNHPGAAELVATTDPAPLAEAVRRMIEDPDRRRRQGEAAFVVGARLFDPAAVFARFSEALTVAVSSQAAFPAVS